MCQSVAVPAVDKIEVVVYGNGPSIKRTRSLRSI